MSTSPMAISPEMSSLLRHLAQEQHPRKECMSPIAFDKLHHSVQQRLPAVCQIFTETPTGPKANGTGFLIGPDLLMTNHHVLPTLEVAEKSHALFFKYLTQDSSSGPINLTLNRVNLLPHKEKGGYFLTGASSADPFKKDLDYTIVAIEPNEETRKVERCAFSLFQARAPRQGEKIVILHHPDIVDATTMIRGAIMISNGVIQSLPTEDETHYNVDTAPGSSGGPVIDIDGQIIDLHYAGGGSCNCSANNHTCNAGIPISSILKHIAQEERTVIEKRSEVTVGGKPCKAAGASAQGISQGTPTLPKSDFHYGSEDVKVYKQKVTVRGNFNPKGPISITPQELQEAVNAAHMLYAPLIEKTSGQLNTLTKIGNKQESTFESEVDIYGDFNG